MNNTIKFLFVLLTGIVVGYLLNDTFNTATKLQPNNKNLVLNTADKLTAQDCTPQDNIENKAANIKPAISRTDTNQQQTDFPRDLEPEHSSTKADVFAWDSKAVSQTQTEPSYHDTASVQEKSEIKQWAKNHIDDLEQIMDDNFPENIAENMKAGILENNDFLNDTELQQQAELDENWAYLMEQDIRSLIAQDQNSDGFQLLQVTCKQLVCDILGIETQPYSWNKIMSGLFRGLSNIRFETDSSKIRNLSWFQDDISYTYAQLLFKQA
ncbi:hypothetical protein N7931_16845 [Catenovulum sp. 2E275]|uniref:hypothetical protein n=1 Tax=Catenovulum sp. 2E275 TaxID=2980497 RepID=UPI0021CFF32C|nr:hypothetical protein [Catenovulum sp. 2E275]MCU4677293.1 hypothetical protein [Catenovulum sp. 2E275]